MGEQNRAPLPRLSLPSTRRLAKPMSKARTRREFLAATAAAAALPALRARALAQAKAAAGIEYRTAEALVAALAARQVSAVELTNHAIARIEALDGRINAVVVRDFE